MNRILVKSQEEEILKKSLESKTDPESLRLKRFLSMPDLSRTKRNPINEIVENIINHPDFKEFDVIEVPEIVPYDISFDLFDFPKDHPARFKSDTYFVDEKNVLRTHTTVMWYYYLNDSSIKEKIKNNEPVGCFSFGKVYRKDEIDRKHMNVFHQIDGWYLIPKNKKIITTDDLQDVLAKIAKAAFGPDVKYRFNKDTFPYTDPSLEMEIERDGKWIEVLGSGVVKGSVLEKLGVDSKIYNGWAFGFGIERLAIASMDLPDIRLLWSEDERVKKQLNLGNKFKEVSKYPLITRDISFIVDKSFIPNNYFELIRDIGGDLVNEVQLIDKYEDEKKFGDGKISYTYRIIYRSNERTLTIDEVDPIQSKIYSETAKQFGAELR
jgi:phenylalanyl-tRNA synthetase alpha chain